MDIVTRNYCCAIADLLPMSDELCSTAGPPQPELVVKAFVTTGPCWQINGGVNDSAWG